MAELRDDKSSEVDITSLEASVAWLQGLEQRVRRMLVQEPAGKLKISDHAVFGGFPGATDAAATYGQLYAASVTAYQGLEKELGKTADGTERIIANYRTVEEQNRASMADIARLLSGDSPPSAGSPASATASTATAASPAPAPASGAATGPAGNGVGGYGG